MDFVQHISNHEVSGRRSRHSIGWSRVRDCTTSMFNLRNLLWWLWQRPETSKQTEKLKIFTRRCHSTRLSVSFLDSFHTLYRSAQRNVRRDISFDFPSEGSMDREEDGALSGRRFDERQLLWFQKGYAIKLSKKKLNRLLLDFHINDDFPPKGHFKFRVLRLHDERGELDSR